MLDAFAYPVSVLMQFCHRALGPLFAPDPGPAWVGSILLLVVLVRLILLAPAWAQLRAARRTAALRPRLAALRREHGADRAGYAAAARRLQQEEGVGAVGCLPVLVQVPVSLGLYHLLAGFTVADAVVGNGVFGPEEVQSVAHATLFGVPLAAAVRTPAAVLELLQAGLGVGDVLVVAVPLLLVAAAAALVSGWVAARRQPPVTADDDPLTTSLGSVTRMMTWLAPLSLLAGGLLFPVPLALLLYWATNGTWTTVQAVLLERRLDRLGPSTAPRMSR